MELSHPNVSLSAFIVARGYPEAWHAFRIGRLRFTWLWLCTWRERRGL